MPSPLRPPHQLPPAYPQPNTSPQISPPTLSTHPSLHHSSYPKYLAVHINPLSTCPHQNSHMLDPCSHLGQRSLNTAHPVRRSYGQVSHRRLCHALPGIRACYSCH